MYQSIKMVSCSNNSSKMIPCIICKKNYKTKANLKEHIQNIHRRDNQDLVVFHCHFRGCNKSFLEQDKFEVHIKTIHNARESGKCDICGKLFVDYRKNNRHIRSVHKSFDLEVECKFCKKRFSTLQALKAHLGSVKHKEPHPRNEINGNDSHLGLKELKAKNQFFCPNPNHFAFDSEKIKTEIKEEIEIANEVQYFSKINLKIEQPGNVKNQITNNEICGKKVSKKSEMTNNEISNFF